MAYPKQDKSLCTIDISPSKYLVSQRIMHGKLPIDENIKLRGCFIPSMCKLCIQHEESSFHLCFECPFAINILMWLLEALDVRSDFNTVMDLWSLCDKYWSSQCIVVIQIALINTLESIWYYRNMARF